MKQSEYEAHVRLWQKKAEELDKTLGTLPPEVGTYLEGEMSLLVGDMMRVMREINDDGESTAATVADLAERMTEMEARDFANRVERDIDMEKWRGGIAARVGHDLEEVTDKLMEIIEANDRGEDVREALFNIHTDVICIMSDLLL